MKLKLWFIFMVLTVVILSTSIVNQPINVKADAGEERTIYLSATEYDYPPFSVTSSGEADGFSVDLLKAVAEEMGIEITFKIDHWSVIKLELEDGELDILPLVGYTPERDEVFDFTVPYIVMRGNIFVRKGDTLIQSQDDLFGKDILVLDGDNSQEWALSIGLNEELNTTVTYTEAFELLASGSYDAVLAQGLVGEKIISDNGLTNLEAVYVYENDGVTRQKLNLEGYEQKFCFAVVEGDNQLLSVLNEGLSIVSVNGTYDELYQEWFPFLIENQPMPLSKIITYVAYIVSPLLLIGITAYILIMKKNIKTTNNKLEANHRRNQRILNAFQNELFITDQKYQDMVSELVDLTSSSKGFVYQAYRDGKVKIRACCNALKSTTCNHETLNKIIEENDRFGNMNTQNPYILNNKYIKNQSNPLIICEEAVHRYLAVNVKNHDSIFVCVLFNKETDYSLEDINQTSILLTGLWNIIQRHKQYEEIRYLSFHDELTELYNRRFFNEELKRYDNQRNYPLTLIMADVNGLKLINDALGHAVGDDYLKLASSIIKNESRANDVVARWGGDEFVIIMPNSNSEAAKKLISRIEEQIEKSEFEQAKLSIAFGYGTKLKKEEDMDEIFKSAEEMMYYKKNEVVESVRSETINMILNTLFDKYPEVRDHSYRVAEVATIIAKSMKLSENKINDISTMAKVHDIGKITIDSNIIEKSSKLTEEEWKIIKEHPLTGSKMLSSTHEYTRLAPGVLHHHERIDGLGYPNQLKGDEIPLESKIISVADAFDAMTSVRRYKQEVMTYDEVKEEFIRCSGTQFDAEVVAVFIEKIINKEFNFKTDRN